MAPLCWLAFFHRLGALGLMDKTEALFVEVAHQMLQRGDWVTPWWNGQVFFDYPVWGYWMVALSFRLFGVSEWAARLPVASAASAVVVATFLLVWQLARPGEELRQRWLRAALAAGVLATTPAWIGWGRSATTDMFLASAITLALYGFLLAHHAHQGHWHERLGQLGMALFAGIAVLAKGPVGLLLPGLVVFVFLTLSAGWGRWWRPGRLLAMGSLFLGVVLPWYGAAAQTSGVAFVGGFLGFSNLKRFTSVLYDHPGPPWFYLPWILLLLLPWSVFLPAAILQLRFWRPVHWRSAPTPLTGEGIGHCDPPASPAVPLFLLLWLALVLAFFSAAATKLPGYILPCIPAAALLIALYWRPFEGGAAKGRALRSGALLEAGLLSLMAVAAALAPRWAASDPANPGLAAALQSSGLPAVLALVLALMALALVLLLRRPAADGLLWTPSLIGFLALLALVITPLAPLLDKQRQLPLRQLARDARLAARPNEPLWVVGTKRYSMVFYAGESAAFVAHRRFIASRLGVDPASLLLRPDSRSVRLVGDRRDLEALGIPAAAITRLSRRNQQELWRVPLVSLPQS
ncbi:MAG: ArnT family glycosyltransferase [Cyanobium sp.]